jgi:hypothetical protein
MNISQESIKKLIDINTLLNQVEIKGVTNINIMYNSLIMLNQVLQQIQDDNKEQVQGITIDNTKGGKK